MVSLIDRLSMSEGRISEGGVRGGEACYNSQDSNCLFGVQAIVERAS